MKIKWAESRECYSFSDNKRVISLDLPFIRTREVPRVRSVTGYGSRLPTDFMVNLDGRLHRVYCRIYSNSGSLFIEKGGFRFYVNETSITDESEIKA